MSDKDARDAALEPALRDVENIQSLDTARLALRWALERMRAIERRVSEEEDRAKGAENARAKLAAELDAARDLLTRRAGETAERERYYAKIEEYLNLRLAGGLDASDLARREARLEEREAALQAREIEGERKLKAARERYEEELKRSLSDARDTSDARLKEAQAEYQRRESARERELSERLISLHERDAQLTALERSLEERRKRFEEFFAAQRAALTREAEALGQAASDQAEFVERRIEQALAAKSRALESGWNAEKRALMEELAEWRGKAREHLPEALEAERRAAEQEERARRLEEDNHGLLQAKTALSEELSRWRSQAQSDLPALLATVRRAVEAEERAKHLEVELASVERRAQEAVAENLSAEIGEEARRRELAKLEDAIAARLRDAEQDLFRRYDAWAEREDELRRRDQDWRRDAEARRESVETLRADVLAQRDELKRTIAEYRAKAESFGLSGRKDGGT
jgi:hypothetical protein